jgi:anti-sigma-K factor RskA
LTCTERRDAIFMLAAEQLEGVERNELRAHLDTDCPRCLGALTTAQAALAKLALALEPIEPPTALRDRLRARVQADATYTHAPVVRSRGRSRGWQRPALAAGIAALLAFAAGRITTHSQVERLESETELSRAALGVLASPYVSEVDLSGQALGFRGWARMYLDQGSRDCYLRAAVVNKPADGQSYVLWFTTADGTPRRGGVLEVAENGEVTLLTEMPPEIDPTAPVYVTPERDPTVAAPTAKPLLVGLLDSI